MALEEITPTVQQVARLIRARTKDSLGAEVGTFNGDTRPTDTAVEDLIHEAVSHVDSMYGGEPCEDNLKARAKGLAAIYTAMLIEQSYFPEQVNSNFSPYDKLERLFDKGVTSLAKAVSEACGGQGTEDEPGASVLPVFDFDSVVDVIGIDGPAT